MTNVDYIESLTRTQVEAMTGKQYLVSPTTGKRYADDEYVLFHKRMCELFPEIMELAALMKVLYDPRAYDIRALNMFKALPPCAQVTAWVRMTYEDGPMELEYAKFVHGCFGALVVKALTVREVEP